MPPCLPLPSDRAMAHYDCEVKAVLGQAVIFLKSPEERDNIVAILIITEVSPSWPPPLLLQVPSGPQEGQRTAAPFLPDIKAS